ncbi:SMP-30/gluconolactonase/LRE family protein [Streptosporangium sp. NPDC020072]|uniref:SMP-30/gluconolactonase/LRE family protein n=1 Tax=Streptosporangium sp. NPDC020072 TaxID=3154788 RepID=UPI00343C72E2
MSSPRLIVAAAATTLTALLSLAPALPASGAPATTDQITRARISTAYELPGDRVYPEGVAVDPRTGDLYAGSYTDGTVFKMTPGHRVAQVFLPAGADGRDTANGLKVDRAGRLWVTDSTTGVSVYDTRTRRLLASFDVPGQAPDNPAFVNDLAIAPDGNAYLTDSVRSVVYRVTPRQVAAGGRTTLTVRFDLGEALDPHGPDAFTLNGIVADPSGHYLLTPDMTGGDLYRLDIASGAIRRVTLTGGDTLHADGLELRGGRLWVVHNTENTISRWKVTRDGAAARVERRLTDEALQLPTTLAFGNGTLYVVRSQFDKGGPLGSGTPRTPFTIASVRGI